MITARQKDISESLLSEDGLTEISVRLDAARTEIRTVYQAT